AKVVFTPHPDRVLGEKAALVVLGRSYAALSILKDTERLTLVRGSATKARTGIHEVESLITRLTKAEHNLRVEVRDGGECHYQYSLDGRTYENAGEPFQAVEGHWIGAKIGLFATRTTTINDTGWLDVDWFRVSAAD